MAVFFTDDIQGIDVLLFCMGISWTVQRVGDPLILNETLLNYSRDWAYVWGNQPMKSFRQAIRTQ